VNFGESEATKEKISDLVENLPTILNQNLGIHDAFLTQNTIMNEYQLNTF